MQLLKPSTHPLPLQFGKGQFNLDINDRLRIEGQLSGSRLNKNIIGDFNSLNGVSHFVNIHTDTIGLDLFKLKLKQGQLVLKNNKKPFTGFENII